MDINPNKAFKNRGSTSYSFKMTSAQRYTLERLGKELSLSLGYITARALGKMTKTADLSYADAHRCIEYIRFCKKIRGLHK